MHLRRVFPILVLAGSIVAGSATAADGPDRGRAPAGVRDQAESIRIEPSLQPAVRAGTPVPSGHAVLRMLPLGSPEDKGSFFTDGAHGAAPGGLTDLERAKLEGARAAVEEARAAGTLFSVRRAEEGVFPDAAAVEAAKLRTLRAMSRAPIESDPAAGIGPGFQPVQKAGPAGLNAIERAKLEALRATAPPDATKRPATGDSERKGGR